MGCSLAFVWKARTPRRCTAKTFSGNENFRRVVALWSLQVCELPPTPPWRDGKNLCQKVCFLTEPHLHIWIIHGAYKHIKWNVAMRHLKAEIRPFQLIIRKSNVSGWTPTPGSPPLVWWLYAQTIDKVSSYRLLRCWSFKRGFLSLVLLCRQKKKNKTTHS